MNNCSERVRNLEEQMRKMMIRIKMLESKDISGSVNIGGIPFMNEADILTFIEREIPPSYPFG